MKKIYLVALMSITTFAAAFAAEWESGIKVFGTQITSDNVSDLMSLFNDSEAEGTVTYDHATQTLTLTNVLLTSHDVWNNFFRFTSTAANKQFKVVVNGMCGFYNNGNKHSVFFAESGITITFEGGSSDPYKDAIQILEGNGFCAENGTMIFRDVALDFTDVIFPLSGNSKSDLLALTLDHCTLMAHPTSIFGNLSEFNMVNCYFKQPADAVYNPDKHRVESNGNELANMDVQISASDKQGIEEVGIQPSAVSGQKVLRDGMLLIERNGKTYNAQGAEVR